jgi:4-hydroxybenzoate polyprenyltransferase
VGAGAAGIDFAGLLGGGVSCGSVLRSFACMFVAIVLNTLVYDTIYGHQDLADDMKVGVKSSAVAWNRNTKWICSMFGAVEVALLTATGSIARLGFGFDILAVGGTIYILASTLHCVKLDNPASCMWGFKRLICGTGIAWALGLFSACIR